MEPRRSKSLPQTAKPPGWTTGGFGLNKDGSGSEAPKFFIHFFAPQFRCFDDWTIQGATTVACAPAHATKKTAGYTNRRQVWLMRKHGMASMSRRTCGARPGDCISCQEAGGYRHAADQQQRRARSDANLDRPNARNDGAETGKGARQPIGASERVRLRRRPRARQRREDPWLWSVRPPTAAIFQRHNDGARSDLGALQCLANALGLRSGDSSVQHGP